MPAHETRPVRRPGNANVPIGQQCRSEVQGKSDGGTVNCVSPPRPTPVALKWRTKKRFVEVGPNPAASIRQDGAIGKGKDLELAVAVPLLVGCYEHRVTHGRCRLLRNADRRRARHCKQPGPCDHVAAVRHCLDLQVRVDGCIPVWNDERRVFPRAPVALKRRVWIVQRAVLQGVG